MRKESSGFRDVSNFSEKKYCDDFLEPVSNLLENLIKTPRNDVLTSVHVVDLFKINNLDGLFCRLPNETRESFIVTQAASCLILPENGDRVMVLYDGVDVWVTSILRKHPANDSILNIELPGKTVNFKAENIKFDISSNMLIESENFTSRHMSYIFTAEERMVYIKGYDALKSGSMSTVVEGTYNIISKTFKCQADKLLKLDSSQIHLG